MPWNVLCMCPGSVSPHALRRGYVTAARNAGQPEDVTRERVNMSGKVLEKHYDKGTSAEKAERGTTLETYNTWATDTRLLFENIF